jgi:hypothetical protein
MARRLGIVEMVVPALFAITACASEPMPLVMDKPVYGSGTSVPDGVDYAMAVQCGGLLSALGAVDVSRPRQLASQSALFREWAETRARESAQDATLAMPDIAAARESFLVLAGSGTNAKRREKLAADHEGDVRVCKSLSEAADFDIVVVGG